MPSAYPLSWPAGWQRTPPGQRRTPQFRSVDGAGTDAKRVSGIRLATARERLADEIEKIGGVDGVLSTNMPLRVDGTVNAAAAAPGDPGAAVYFRLKGRDVALACDRWNSVAGNVAAIAAHIKAMRAQDRWGVGTIEQAFTGYLALPAPMVVNDWRTTLNNPATLAAAEATYRAKMALAHPDIGGSHAAASALNAAIAEARKAMT